MFNKKEIGLIIAVIIIVALSLSFLKGLETFFHFLAYVFLIIIINIFAKKIACYYVESEIEIKLWQIKRFGFKPTAQFKRPFPAGALFPLLFSVLTFGNFIWLASLVFDIKPKVYRAAKRHGLYSFSEMTESHIGIIAAAGIFATLVFAVIAYLVGYSDFARLSIYYAFFNMIPISNLDGNKIFFGNLVLWSFLATITLIGLGLAFFLV